MGLKLGDIVPDFSAETTQGKVRMHEFVQDSWAILFSHPNDFTPVCTTELGRVAQMKADFDKRGVKVLALSCNSAASHAAWIPDIEALASDDGCKVWYPIIADPDRSISLAYGMLDPDETDPSSGMPMSARAVFVIGPDKKLKLSILYPATTGRNFHEILRVLDSLLLTARHPVATPADWVQGADCMVLPSLSHSQALQALPKGFSSVPLPSGKDYVRITPNPQG